jgi:hypothetical protein
MQNIRQSAAWLLVGVSLGALSLQLLIGEPFTAKAQEPKRFQYQIIEVIPDTETMQTKLNEFGSNGWELAGFAMGNMTNPRMIFKK